MKKLYLLLAMLTMIVCSAVAQTGDPIFTFGCLSDIHSQESMISASDVSDVKLRTAFTTSLQKIKAKENIDALVLGGDYTSDVTISETNWKKVRSLMGEAVLAAFPSTATRTPVIYTVGNHDFEVANFDNLPKGYVAGDFYSYPMKGQTGYLAPSECFYETAENGTSDPVSLLAAYHYQIKGFDFVVLNCGKYFFKSAWDYQDSQESVDWVAAKLNEIDPDGKKTIFFINHLPLPNSVGATSNKCLTDNDATKTLVTALAKHPGIVYLYGHDHSSTANMSYITDKVSQRVTHYDSNGSIMTESGSVSSAYIQSYADQTKYLVYSSSDNLTTATDPAASTISTGKSDGTFSLKLSDYYVHCGSSGRFSGNNTLSNNSSLIAYEINTSTGVGTQVTSLEYGKTYAFCAPTTSSGGAYYYISNVGYSSGTSHRMTGVAVGGTPSSTATISDNTCWWTLVNPSVSATSSFYSCFMGSMRYNNLDTNSSPGTSDSPIIQALIVRVYSDGIVLDMQNYGETGELSGTAVSPTIADPLESFKISRTTVKASDITYTVTVTGADDGRVIYNGTEYKNGDTFTTNYTISVEELSAKELTDYYSGDITIGDEGAITLTYTEPAAITSAYIKSYADQTQYLTYTSSDNLHTVAEPSSATIGSGSETSTVSVKWGSVSIHAGSSGYFSGNGSGTDDVMVYEVDPTTLKGTLVSTLKYGRIYALASYSSKVTSLCVVSNETNGTLGTDCRMIGSKVTDTDRTITVPSTKYLWTLEKYAVSCSTDGGGVVYNGNEYTNNETFSSVDDLTVDDVTAASVDGYKGNVTLSGTVFTSTYHKMLFDESKAYVIKLKNEPSDETTTYGPYLTLNTNDDNYALRGTDAYYFYFQMQNDGTYYINSSQDMSGSYLGAESWNAMISSSAVAWTVAETESGYTFNQQTASYKGYLGAEKDKAKLYCNKGTSDPIYFDVIEDPRKEQFDESAPYYLSLATVPDETYGAYVDMINTTSYTSGSTTYTDLPSRSTTAAKVYFEYAGSGQWKIKSSTADDAKYLTWEKRYYLSEGTEKIVPWTITKSDKGYTLYQNVNTYAEGNSADSYGYLAAEANKKILYMDKESVTDYSYFNITMAPYKVSTSSDEAPVIKGTISAASEVKDLITDKATSIDLTGATFSSDLLSDIQTKVKETCGDNVLMYVSNVSVVNLDNVVLKTGDEYACTSLVLTDGTGNSKFNVPMSFLANKASYERPNSNDLKWGTVCLPYAPQTSDEIVYYELTSQDGNTLKFTKVATPLPNVPYLYKNTSEANYKAEQENIEVKATPSGQSITGGSASYVLKGVYQPSSIVDGSEGYTETKSGYPNLITDANSLYIKSGSFWKINGRFTLKPFRAYITTKESGARYDNMVISVDDAVTGVTFIERENGNSVDVIYDVNGARLQNMKNGINIVNGKKVIK